jgi:predicted TIM-barrel fold metal-dependent hydrolase
VIAKDDPRYPIIRGIEPGWVGMHDVTLEELLPRMDAAGVAKATLVQAFAGHGFDNRYTADSAARYPGRFVAVGMLDPVAEDAVATMRRWVSEHNVRGFRVRPGAWAIDDPRTYPVWEAAAELAVPLVIWRVSPDLFPAYRTMLARFPNVKVAHDHSAHTSVADGPPYAAAQPLFDLACYPNLSIKFATNILINCLDAGYEPDGFLGCLVDAFGAERVMWGSNYPALHEPDWPLTRMTEVARAAVARFSKREQRLVLGEAAQRLWPELAG